MAAMVDYSKKTVAELTEILKSRSLPHSGKKADLVSRLNEADKTAEENEAEKAPPAESTSGPPAQEPEPAPAPASKPAPEKPAPAAPAEAAPVADEEAQDSPSANTDTALANSASYALNLPHSEVDSEMAKRKSRAERFGTGAPAANGEAEENATEGDAQKALDRAKRFGTGQTTVGKLDEALPEERERGSRKRGRPDETGAMDDPALRRGFGGRGGRGGGRGARPRGRERDRRDGRDNSRRRTGEKPSGVSKPSGAFSSDADRAAAEARRKKFASAS